MKLQHSQQTFSKTGAAHRCAALYYEYTAITAVHSQ